MIMQMNQSGPDEPESEMPDNCSSCEAETVPSVTYGFVPLHPGLHNGRLDSAHPIPGGLYRRSSRPRSAPGVSEECGNGLYFG